MAYSAARGLTALAVGNVGLFLEPQEDAPFLSSASARARKPQGGE